MGGHRQTTRITCARGRELPVREGLTRIIVDCPEAGSGRPVTGWLEPCDEAALAADIRWRNK